MKRNFNKRRLSLLGKEKPFTKFLGRLLAPEKKIFFLASKKSNKFQSLTMIIIQV
jgi:hypothetical protein